MPTAAEVINYSQNEGMLAMAHLEGACCGSQAVAQRSTQQGLQSEKSRPSEFTANYGLLCPQQAIPCVSHPPARNTQHRLLHPSVPYLDAAAHNR